MPVELDDNIKLGNLDSATFKDVWFINYRPQIQILMSGPSDNHLAALLLMIACMDRVYTLAFPAKSGTRMYTQDMLKYFFPKPDGEDENEYNERMKKLANDLVNALKHNSFVKENVLLSDAAYLVAGVGVDGQAIEVMIMGHRRIAVTWEDDGKLTIAATAFWNHVRDHIDNFYMETTARIK